MSSSAAHSQIDIGSVIAGTYRIERILGRGGMGTVWEAHHTRLPGKKVAIKILHGTVADDADALARFRREAEIACRLGHPNIVEVHDFNKHENGCPYLILELLHGRPLDERLREGPLAPKSAEHVLRQVASALQSAHEQGVIHRDLKPQNVFLVPSPTGVGPDIAKVLDFGISKIRGSTTVKTQESTLLGTPQYMAPEQATGKHDQVDARTDLFALASMAYEILSGKPAFSGQSIPEVVYKVVHEEPAPLGSLAEGIPELQQREIHKALSKKQEERHESVQAFIEAMYGEALVHKTGSHRAQSASQLAEAATVDSSKLDLAEAHTLDSAKLDMGQALTVDSAKMELGAAQTIDSGKMDKEVIALGAAETVDSGRMDTGEVLALVDDEKELREPVADKSPRQQEFESEHGKGAPKRTRRNKKAWLAAPAVVAASLALYVASGGKHADEGGADVASPAAGARAMERDETATAPAPESEVTNVAAGDSERKEPDEPSQTRDAGPTAQEAQEEAPLPNEPSEGKEPRKDATRPHKIDRKAPDKESESPPDSPAATPELSPEAEQALAEASAALKSGDYATALFNAKKANRIQQSARGYLLQAKVHCARQDIAGFRSVFSKVPRRARRALRRFCEREGFELPSR